MYLLLLEQVRTAAQAHRAAVLTGAVAAGVEVDADDLPDPEAAVARFDTLLVAEPGELVADPDGVDAEGADLLIGLGLRR